LGILAIVGIGCNTTKHLKPEDLFLQKVIIKKDNRKIDKDELANIIKQKPNRKILKLFRYHLGLYNFVNKKNVSIFKDMGEPPVAYDSLLTHKSIKQLHIYLDNKGYYDNKVTYELKIKKNRVKWLKYNIKTGAPYLIRNLKYEVEDKNVETYVLLNHIKTLIRKGTVFDIDLLDKERTRIKQMLQNEGYYYFNKNYIKFKVDSTIGNKQIDIAVLIANKKVQNTNNKDSVISVNHQKFSVNDVNVYIKTHSNTYDTVKYKDLIVYYANKLNYRPRMLNHSIGLKKGETYRLKNRQSTYKHLSELQLFKSIDIEFEDVNGKRLNTNIYLTPSYSKSFSIEATGTNSGGNLGTAGSLIYTNKNIFKGG